MPAPQVIVLMGSKSDWDDVKHARDILKEFDIPHECRVLSAHRVPTALIEYVQKTDQAGAKAYIACAGGAAHLAGVVAGHTVKPVLGVPMDSKLDGLDSLLSTVSMPRGIPVGTFAIGKAGAVNAALFAAAIIGTQDQAMADKIQVYRDKKAEAILAEKLD